MSLRRRAELQLHPTQQSREDAASWKNTRRRLPKSFTAAGRLACRGLRRRLVEGPDVRRLASSIGCCHGPASAGQGSTRPWMQMPMVVQHRVRECCAVLMRVYTRDHLSAGLIGDRGDAVLNLMINLRWSRLTRAIAQPAGSASWRTARCAAAITLRDDYDAVRPLTLMIGFGIRSLRSPSRAACRSCGRSACRPKHRARSPGPPRCPHGRSGCHPRPRGRRASATRPASRAYRRR